MNKQTSIMDEARDAESQVHVARVYMRLDSARKCSHGTRIAPDEVTALWKFINAGHDFYNFTDEELKEVNRKGNFTNA